MTGFRTLSYLAGMLVLLSVSGCASLWPEHGVTQRGASSSLVDFLYSPGETPPATTSTALLELPLRVGIGFLPGASNRSALTESHRDELLNQIKAHFAEKAYIQSIEVIPQTYLTGRDGALVVDQIGRLYDLDVVGLVSYDQAVVSETRKSSLLYWTIIGAYVVKGNRNTVSTFVDLAVVDVRSKKLLLRAGGTHHDQKNTTLVDMSAVNRRSQVDGFSLAASNLMVNFADKLDSFEDTIRSDDSIEIARRSGGSGSIMLELFVLMLMLICRQRIGIRMQQRDAFTNRGF